MTREGITAVYVARVITGEIGRVYPPERDLLIQKTKNESLRRERYSVWMLLTRALADAFSIDIRELDIRRTDSGKWVAEGIYFSLSHTSELVAVAVSDSPVGVDIEAVRELGSKSFAERILSKEEYSEYLRISESSRIEWLISKWSCKEALFKQSEISDFVPREHIVTDRSLEVIELFEDGRKYLLSVTKDSDIVFCDLRS